MGTHPIFESDFDCLTDKNCKMFVSRQVCFLRKLAKAFTRDPRAAARLPDKKYIVGQDHYGNVYFEVGRSRQVSHAIDQLSDEKVKELNTFGKAGQNRIPVEWQQWLRHTRREAPKPEDILMNEHVRMRTLARAVESDRKHQAWKQEQEEEKRRKQEIFARTGEVADFKDENYVDPNAETEEWTPK